MLFRSQGNSFDEVFVYRYVTERSFDAYLWSLVANKAKFIAQIMNSNSTINRTCEDIDEAILNYAEVQAIASGNPLIKEKIEIDNEVSRLQMLKSSYNNERFTLQTNRDKEYPKRIAQCNSTLERLNKDIGIRTEKLLGEAFKISINDITLTSRESAGDMIHAQFVKIKPNDKPIYIASYRGFTLEISKESFSGLPYVVIRGNGEYKVEVNLALTSGIITRIDNQIDRLEEVVEAEKAKLANYQNSLEATTKQLLKPFEYEELLDTTINRQTELSILLDAGKTEEEVLDEEPPIHNTINQEMEYDLDYEDEEDLEL